MRFAASILLLLTAALPLAAQEEALPPPGAEVKSITFLPQAGESLFELLEMKVGEPFSPDALRTSLKNIFRLGVYSDVRALWEPLEGGIALTIELEEIPLVEGVTVLGAGPLSRRAVVSAARLDRNPRFDSDRGRAIAAAIEERYREAGYWNANIQLYHMTNLETGGVRLEINIAPGGQTMLRKLELEGFPVMSEEEILAIFSSTSIRRPFREKGFADDLERLKNRYIEHGYLTIDIISGEPEFNRQDNAVDMRLTVNAGPLIELSFEPSETVVRDWRELIPFQDRNVPLDRIVENGRGNIERHLQTLGHIDAAVKSNVEVDFELGSVNVTLSVARGTGFKVGRLEIEGLDKETESRIRPQLSLTKQGWFATATFSRENLEADVRRVLQLVGNEGYRQAVLIDREVERHDGDRRVDVRLIFDTGPLTRARSIVFSGNESISADVLAEKAGFEAGGVLSSTAVARAMENLISFYDAEGYAEARIATSIVGSAETRDLVFEIDEGRASRIAKVIIAGNDITHDGVIRRALTFGEGDPFSRRELAESQRSLYRLGVFNRVVVGGVDDQLGRRDRRVVVRVRETSPYSLLYGIGVDSEEKLRFSFGVSNTNIAGRNAEVSFSTRVSSLQQRYQISFRAPRIFRGRIDNILRFFYEEVREQGFSARRKGVMVESSGFRIAGWDIIGRYQYKWIDLFDEAEGFFISRFDRSIRLSLVSAILTRDRRDDIVDPTRGYLANAIFQYSPGWLRSEADYFKSQFQFYTFKPLPAGSVLAAGARLGLAWPFAGSEDLPLSEQFFFNGITTMRGFELSEPRPEDIGQMPFTVYGNSLLISNLEFRFPLWWELGGVVFYDSGSAFPYVSDFSFSKLVHAAGMGLRYATPLGPLRVDYTWDLSGYDETLVFSFGHAF